jgi:type IV pilus assembly protein PilW
MKTYLDSSRQFLVRKNERGVSLIELMVGMVIALLIAAAIGSLYLGSKESSRLQEGTSAARESGLAITELVTREVRKAGHYGCYRVQPGAGIDFLNTALLPTAQDGSYPLPTAGAPLNLEARIGPRYDISGGDVSGLTLPSSTTLTKVAGSDYVAVSYGQPVRSILNDINPWDTPIQVGEPIFVKSGQPFLIADCKAMQLLRVDDGGVNGAWRTVLNHDPALGDNVAPPNNSEIGGVNIGRGGLLMSLEASSIFLATDSAGRTGLYVWDTASRTPSSSLQPFAKDVVKFKVLFGVNNGGTILWTNGAAVTSAGQWPLVHALQVHYVVASAEATASLAPKEMVWDAAKSAYVLGTAPAAGNKAQTAYSSIITIRGRTPGAAE